jgi:hypothetical protein
MLGDLGSSKMGNQKDILHRREEKNQKGKGETPGTTVVITDKPGLRDLQDWWEESTGEKMTNNFGEHFSKTEVVILPSEL